MTQGSDDFEALARQYWGMWGDALRGLAPQAGGNAGMQGFRDALSAWSSVAGGGHGGFDNVLGHFNRQNGDWFAQMEQVAAQFAGREHGAQDVARAWQRALGGNPFQGLFHGMRGPGLEGLEQWSEAAAGPLESGQPITQLAGLPRVPAFRDQCAGQRSRRSRPALRESQGRGQVRRCGGARQR